MGRGRPANSPIPHLHFHVQNSPTWFQGDGLPVFFHGATVNGKPQVDVEPVRGAPIAPREAGSLSAGLHWQPLLR